MFQVTYTSFSWLAYERIFIQSAEDSIYVIWKEFLCTCIPVNTFTENVNKSDLKSICGCVWIKRLWLGAIPLSMTSCITTSQTLLYMSVVLSATAILSRYAANIICIFISPSAGKQIDIEAALLFLCRRFNVVTLMQAYNKGWCWNMLMFLEWRHQFHWTKSKVKYRHFCCIGQY